MREKVIIDCDTGIDDALALVLMLSRPETEVIGITTVAGNVSIDNTTRNTCNVVHLLGRDDIKIARGASCPLMREPLRASGVHGVSGLRGYDFAEDFSGNLLDIEAVEYMRSLLLSSSDKVTILAVAPLTNIARLLMTYPEVKDRIRRIVFMGTSYHSGNPTPLATFNVLVDPEAFRIVAFSGIEFVACPLDTARHAVIENSEIEDIGHRESEVARFVYGILSGYGLSRIRKDEVISEENEEVISENRLKAAREEKAALLDPAAAAFVVRPELFRCSKYYCDVECKGEITTGFTFIDKEDYYKKSDEERNLTLIEDMDREGFIRLFMDSIDRYGECL